MPVKIDPFRETLSRLDQVDNAQVEENTPYQGVLKTLRDRKAGAVLVCRNNKVVGILTERDILNKYFLENIAAHTPVSQLMTRNPVTVGPQTTVRQAIQLMHAKHIRNLPIVDEKGHALGLLTVGRIIRYLAYHFPAEVVNLPPRPTQLTQELEGA